MMYTWKELYINYAG